MGTLKTLVLFLKLFSLLKHFSYNNLVLRNRISDPMSLSNRTLTSGSLRLILVLLGGVCSVRGEGNEEAEPKTLEMALHQEKHLAESYVSTVSAPENPWGIPGLHNGNIWWVLPVCLTQLIWFIIARAIYKNYTKQRIRSENWGRYELREITVRR